MQDIIDNHLGDTDTFFMLLSSAMNTPLYPRESLIIFDEVQQYPRVRQEIKYLVKDGRYDYIETGSLISIKENVADITIPSEEESIRMYPMDFEEWLWAIGKDMSANLIRYYFDKQEPLPQAVHHEMMLLLRQYMIVGGMPKPLSAYLENGRDLWQADKEKRKILELYRKDIRKISRKYQAKVLTIFDQIPGLLAKHDKRVVFKDIQNQSDFSSYGDTFFWLEDSMITNMCFLTSDPNVGLALNEDRAYLKCYMGDTGLLISHAFSENTIAKEGLYRQLLLDKLSINEGMLFENLVAQMLVANGHRLFFYTHYDEAAHRNDIEIDFIISNDSKVKQKIYPIEVKSTRVYSTTSLDRFQSRFHERIGGQYVIHTKNLKKEGNTLYLPAYMTWLL